MKYAEQILDEIGRLRAEVERLETEKKELQEFRENLLSQLKDLVPEIREEPEVLANPQGQIVPLTVEVIRRLKLELSAARGEEEVAPSYEVGASLQERNGRCH